MLAEAFFLFRSIAVGVLFCAVAHIVSYIVVGEETVGAVDATVDEDGHFLYIFGAGKTLVLLQFLASQRFADVDAHRSFPGHDAGDDAVEVFARFLHISGKARFV